MSAPAHAGLCMGCLGEHQRIKALAITRHGTRIAVTQSTLRVTITGMTTEFLTVRLTAAESKLVQQLHIQTGLTKSALVKHALARLSEQQTTAVEGGLFALGAGRFGRHGDASRQSADIKSIVRKRVRAKRTDR